MSLGGEPADSVWGVEPAPKAPPPPSSSVAAAPPRRRRTTDDSVAAFAALDTLQRFSAQAARDPRRNGTNATLAVASTDATARDENIDAAAGVAVDLPVPTATVPGHPRPDPLVAAVYQMERRETALRLRVKQFRRGGGAVIVTADRDGSSENTMDADAVLSSSRRPPAAAELIDFVADLVDLGRKLAAGASVGATPAATTDEPNSSNSLLDLAELVVARAEMLSRWGLGSRRRNTDEDWLILAWEYDERGVRRCDHARHVLHREALETIAFIERQKGRYADALIAMEEAVKEQGGHPRPQTQLNALSILSLMGPSASKDAYHLGAAVIRNLADRLEQLVSPEFGLVVVTGAASQRQAYAAQRASTALMLLTARLYVIETTARLLQMTLARHSDDPQHVATTDIGAATHESINDGHHHPAANRPLPAQLNGAGRRRRPMEMDTILEDRSAAPRPLPPASVLYLANRVVCDLHDCQRLFEQELSFDAVMPPSMTASAGLAPTSSSSLLSHANPQPSVVGSFDSFQSAAGTSNGSRFAATEDGAASTQWFGVKQNIATRTAAFSTWLASCPLAARHEIDMEPATRWSFQLRRARQFAMSHPMRVAATPSAVVQSSDRRQPHGDTGDAAAVDRGAVPKRRPDAPRPLPALSCLYRWSAHYAGLALALMAAGARPKAAPLAAGTQPPPLHNGDDLSSRLAGPLASGRSAAEAEAPGPSRGLPMGDDAPATQPTSETHPVPPPNLSSQQQQRQVDERANHPGSSSGGQQHSSATSATATTTVEGGRPTSSTNTNQPQPPHDEGSHRPQQREIASHSNSRVPSSAVVTVAAPTPSSSTAAAPITTPSVDALVKPSATAPPLATSAFMRLAAFRVEGAASQAADRGHHRRRRVPDGAVGAPPAVRPLVAPATIRSPIPAAPTVPDALPPPSSGLAPTGTATAGTSTPRAVAPFAPRATAHRELQRASAGPSQSTPAAAGGSRPSPPERTAFASSPPRLHPTLPDSQQPLATRNVGTVVWPAAPREPPKLVPATLDRPQRDVPSTAEAATSPTVTLLGGHDEQPPRGYVLKPLPSSTVAVRLWLSSIGAPAPRAPSTASETAVAATMTTNDGIEAPWPRDDVQQQQQQQTEVLPRAPPTPAPRLPSPATTDTATVDAAVATHHPPRTQVEPPRAANNNNNGVAGPPATFITPPSPEPTPSPDPVRPSTEAPRLEPHHTLQPAVATARDRQAIEAPVVGAPDTAKAEPAPAFVVARGATSPAPTDPTNASAPSSQVGPPAAAPPRAGPPYTAPAAPLTEVAHAARVRRPGPQVAAAALAYSPSSQQRRDDGGEGRQQQQRHHVVVVDGAAPGGNEDGRPPHGRAGLLASHGTVPTCQESPGEPPRLAGWGSSRRLSASPPPAVVIA